MPTRSEFDIRRFTLLHRSILSGTTLTPQWALVRARRVLDDNRGATAEETATGALAFDYRLSSVTFRGAYVPNTISGRVSAEPRPDGIVVTASASLAEVAFGIVLSTVAFVLYFRFGLLEGSPRFFWALIAVVNLASAWRVRQAARLLKRLTIAATSI